MNRLIRTSLCVLMLFLPACGTMEISIVGTPTTDIAATGTIAALQAQNSALAAQVATLNVPTETLIPSPTPMPTNTPVPAVVAVIAATRITFLDGATVGMVEAPIHAGQSQVYILKASKSQPMFVYAASLHNDVTVSIDTQDNLNILSAAAKQTSWQGSLPQTEDYYITVHGGASTENFSLAVTIPTRIIFPPGAVFASVTGTTVAGYGVSYTAFAGKGQTMSVDLENLSAKASISIYGFTDGQHYLRSEKGLTSYHFVLPATQDYIVVVMPAAGIEVSYTMTITIQ
jgi:hypothetical protein